MEFPWAIPLDRVAKAEAYDAEGKVQGLTAKVGEFLNGLLKNETFKGLYEAGLYLYPDMVCVAERPPGCLARLLMRLPRPIQAILAFVLSAGIMGILFLPFALILMVVLSPVLLVLWLVGLVTQKAYLGYLRRVAARVRANPKSSYAIKKMFKYSVV